MKKIYFFLTVIIALSFTTKAQIAPGICMVTVDDSSKHNIVYYDKTQFSAADSFILWRETTTPGVYARVMANHNSVLSQFVDMDTAADPNVELHRYKMQVYDQIGGYSQLGPYHTVLYCLQVDTDYSWNLYDVQGSGGSFVNKYMLLRDDNSTNAWHAIDSTNNVTTMAKDTAALSFPNGSWRLVTKWSLSCTTTARQDGHNEVQATIVKSKSNITNNKTMGLNTLKAASLRIYPNPASELVNVRLNFPLAKSTTVKIYDALGAEVMRSAIPAGKDEIELNVSALNAGVYFVEFMNGSVKVNRKLVIQ